MPTEACGHPCSKGAHRLLWAPLLHQCICTCMYLLIHTNTVIIARCTIARCTMYVAYCHTFHIKGIIWYIHNLRFYLGVGVYPEYYGTCTLITKTCSTYTVLLYFIIVISPEDNGQLICCNTSRHLYSLQSRSSLHSDAAYDVTKLRPNSSPVATRDDRGNVRLTEKGHNLLFIGCRDNRENGSFQSNKL